MTTRTRLRIAAAAAAALGLLGTALGVVVAVGGDAGEPTHPPYRLLPDGSIDPASLPERLTLLGPDGQVVGYVPGSCMLQDAATPGCEDLHLVTRDGGEIEIDSVTAEQADAEDDAN